MELSPTELKFVDRRTELSRVWRYAGPLLLACIAALALYFYLSTPLLIDPLQVIAGIEADSIADTTLITMSVMLPIVMLLLLSVLVVLVFYMYAIFSNERKLIAIIKKLIQRA